MSDNKSEFESSPVYLQIALNIAKRIARGELPENSKIYGRSVLSSEYGVSPETIRRSISLLADMQVVEVREKSGTIVLSREKAQAYVERFDEYAGVQALRRQLRKALSEHSILTKQIHELATDISGMSVRMSNNNPFINYEIDVTPDSPVRGKTIKDLNFWQETGATIIAIRRKTQLFLSPGPYFSLEAEDTIVFVGDERTAYAVQNITTNQA